MGFNRSVFLSLQKHAGSVTTCSTFGFPEVSTKAFQTFRCDLRNELIILNEIIKSLSTFLPLWIFHYEQQTFSGRLKSLYESLEGAFTIVCR